MFRLLTSFWSRGTTLWLAEREKSEQKNIKGKDSFSFVKGRKEADRSVIDSGWNNLLAARSNAVWRIIIRVTNAFDEWVKIVPNSGLRIALKLKYLDKLWRWDGLTHGRAITSDLGEAVLWVQRKWAEEVDETSSHASRVVLHWAISWVQSWWALMILPLSYLFVALLVLSFVFYYIILE